MLGRTYGDSDPVKLVFRDPQIPTQPQTGDTFSVLVEEGHAERMLTAFKLQWAAIKIYAIAREVESLKNVGDHPEYLDEELEWLGRPMPTIREFLEMEGQL